MAKDTECDPSWLWFGIPGWKRYTACKCGWLPIHASKINVSITGDTSDLTAKRVVAFKVKKDFWGNIVDYNIVNMTNVKNADMVAIITASGQTGGDYTIKVTNHSMFDDYILKLGAETDPYRVDPTNMSSECRMLLGICNDGTPVGACSDSKKGYSCDNSSGIPELVPNCTRCGCPPNYDCDPESGICVHNVTGEPLDEPACGVSIVSIGTPPGTGIDIPFAFRDISADPPPTPPEPEPEPPPPTPTPAAVKIAIKIAAIIAAAIGGINMTEIDFTQHSIDYLSTCNTTNLSADIPYESQFVFKASNEIQNSSVDAICICDFDIDGYYFIFIFEIRNNNEEV